MIFSTIIIRFLFLESIDSLYLNSINQLLQFMTKLPSNPKCFPVRLELSPLNISSTAVVSKSALPMSLQATTKVSPTTPATSRMQTRSLTSIRSCIARCNRPSSKVSQKRSAPEPNPTIVVSKRQKPSPSNTDTDQLVKFLRVSSNVLNEALKKWIDDKLHGTVSVFLDDFHRAITEMVINRCDIILPFVQRLHPSEESLKLLLRYIQKESSTFQSNLLEKLKQDWNSEVEIRPVINNRIKIIK